LYIDMITQQNYPKAKTAVLVILFHFLLHI
jgi:hypothetical protein